MQRLLKKLFYSTHKKKIESYGSLNILNNVITSKACYQGGQLKVTYLLAQ